MKFVLTILISAVVGLSVVGEAEAHRGDNIKRLDRYLAGTPMAGLGSVLDHQGHLHNISPYFVAAVAGKESSFGAATCSNNPRNVWGLGACGRAWNPPYFRSWTQAINYFVRFVKSRWPSASNPYHFGGYCSGCESSWAAGVSGFMFDMGASHRVTYGR